MIFFFLAQASYNLVRLIFSTLLGFDVATTPRDREEILLSQLKHVEEPECLCVLNQLFNVDFIISPRYTELTKKQKDKMLRNFLLELMQNCFKELCVVIIDNAQYSDNESMKLLRTIIKQDTVFFVFSLGRILNGEYPIISKRAKV